MVIITHGDVMETIGKTNTSKIFTSLGLVSSDRAQRGVG